MKEVNRNLALRIGSAAVLAPLLVAVILWQRYAPMALVIQLAVMVGLAEFFWITLRDDPVWMRVFGLGLGLLVSGTLIWCPRPEAFSVSLVLVTMAAAVVHMVHFGEIRTASARAALMVFGILYLALLLSPLALFKRFPEGADWVFLILTLTWFSDTGAFFMGRALGKHKLYPSMSPGKTVEGALGGLLASCGAALLAKLWYMPQIGWLDVMLVAIPAGALAQAGDLVESMIKRGYQVKDSGWILPGHGGLLDRIDALLFSTPYVYLYALYFFKV